MTSRLRAGYLAVLVAAGSCTDAGAPGASVAAPPAISARALGMHVVRVEWSPPPGGVEAYRLERRTNLTGPFVTIAPVVPPGAGSAILSYLDVDVQPETFYGYRVFALDALGHESSPSVVAGAVTPPRPGIEVSTIATIPVPDAVDPDGYWVTLDGPDSVAAPLGVSDRRRFAPLAPGPYTITLSGVRSSCEVEGGPGRAVTVTDTGVRTVSLAAFQVVCRDPARGRIRVRVFADGDSADANGFVVTAYGILADTTLPDPQRIVQLEDDIPAAGSTITFDRLLPGAYEITLEDVAAHCTVGAATEHEVAVAPLSDDSVRFDVECRGSGGAGRPYVWRNTWSPVSAPPGARVSLAIALDLSAVTSERVSQAQGELRYDPAVLRYDSVSPGALADGFSVNAQTAGAAFWYGTTFGTPPGGTVLLARFDFTITGSAGSTVASRTTITGVQRPDETYVDSLIRVVEDTLVITAPGANQPPNAEANGPYGGTTGTPISVSAAGSSDPDGTIASYSWAFGDGGSASGASPSHSYATAGTYTATLTVTDNLGVTDTDQATVTVTPGGGNQAPVAEANGPYAGTAGSGIAFSAAGSSDPDGTITSYSWAFGDGASATGAAPTHAYGAAGSYTATLTVTDNLGATDTDQATVTITAPGGTTPFTWQGTFGAVNPLDSVVALTITLDLTTDIPETMGPEALATWVLDSLKWDPTVLRFHAFNWGPGGSGVSQTPAPGQGKLSAASFTLPTTANSGVIQVATIRFKSIASARSTTTVTAVGPLTSTSGYNYRPHTSVIEATFTAP